MTLKRDTVLPPWTIVRADDTRFRAGALETSEFVSGEWASAVRAVSNRAWLNAAKVIASIAEERPEARYVEGWATKGGVTSPVWHAWVDVPLGAAELSWLRIDATPMWRWMIAQSRYGPVLEVRASAMAPFTDPLLRLRGKARCRLPLVPLKPDPAQLHRQPMPTESLTQEFGIEVALRAAEVRDALHEQQSALTAMVHVDGRSELDRLAAMRVLPRGR